MTVWTGLPEWVRALLWTSAAVGVGYAAGHIIRASIGGRLARLARRTGGEWDDALVREAGRRLPFWFILIGIYLVLPRWSLDLERYTFAVHVLRAIGVASATLAAAGIAGRLVSSYGARVTPNTPVSALTQNVVRTFVIGLGALVIIGSFDINITPYLTALGVTGLAVALALQDPLSNFFAGVAIGVSGQIRIGDYVKIDETVEGYVVDFNWRTTTIRRLNNPLVIVPNSKLAQAIVTNFADTDLAVAVELQVSYNSDLDRVERVTLEVARQVARDIAGAVASVEPAVRFHTFSQTGVAFSVVFRAHKFSDQFPLKHEFLKRIQARYAAEGIVIPTLEVLSPGMLTTPGRRVSDRASS